MVAMTDWNPVVDALAAAIPGTIAAVIAYMNRRALRTPSGTKIGTQVEQANAVSAVTLAHTSRLLRKNGVEQQSAEQAVLEAEEEVKPLINGEQLPRPRGE